MEYKIRRALLSVSDKDGIIKLAEELNGIGAELLSTGGTAKKIREALIPVKDVSEYTGFPEMMNGRVKTLHPYVHGGLLALRDNPEHMKTAEKNGIKMIDLVAVNLYPFQQTVANPNVTLEDAIENIDIGGPAMLRSAAKNYRSVIVMCDPKDYTPVMQEIMETGNLSMKKRGELAVKVFEHTNSYDGVIAQYLGTKLR
jgi:phosphoribosylaminoimidazolecarboxamide formyltransferase/IMP cyclohydrolase